MISLTAYILPSITDIIVLHGAGGSEASETAPNPFADWVEFILIDICPRIPLSGQMFRMRLMYFSLPHG